MSPSPRPTPTLLPLLLCAALAACGGPLEAEESLGAKQQAVTADYATGTQLRTTGEVNLRAGPGTGFAVLGVVPLGATVVVAGNGGGPTDGFYNVTHGGKTGWAFGAYLLSLKPVLKFGLHPDASDVFRQVGVPLSRIGQTIGGAAASAGYHAKDGTANGADYCAATDLWTSSLTEADIRTLLTNLAKLGVVGWYRKPGFDGWPSNEIAHIHVIYAGAPMKSELRGQVQSWLAGRNGLVSNTTYQFLTWTPAVKEKVRQLFERDAPAGVMTDDDGDGVPNSTDNCPAEKNAGQNDTDKDGKGDVCDSDKDGDGIGNAADNCPADRNGEQADTDKDGKGNACDDDDDGDGKADTADNCPQVANAGQADTDGDGKGDACEDDNDADGVPDATDNCPKDANPNQKDTDADGKGNACDTDDDGDTVLDDVDNCPLTANTNQADADADGVGNACDDAAAVDTDSDGVLDGDDNCPRAANAGQEDADADGKGDACDADADGDAAPDEADNCPGVRNDDQGDADADGVGDACDDDTDNDGVKDSNDNCPNDSNANQADADGDGTGDACEASPTVPIDETGGEEEPPTKPVTGCSAAGGTTYTWMGALALLAVLARRRKSAVPVRAK